MCKEIPPNLNIMREKIVFKGFANIPEIAIFMNCSYGTAKKELEIMNSQAKKENFKTFKNRVSVERLIAYCGLTEKKITQFAEIEYKRSKEKDVPTVESKTSTQTLIKGPNQIIRESKIKSKRAIPL